MKHINLYFLNDRLFIIPNSVLKNGPLIMSGFPIEIELSVPKIKIGIVDAFNQCGYLNEEPKDNYFNIFLKISKAKTNKNLVQIAKLISISEKDDILYLTRLEPNFRYKSFGSNEKLEFKVSEIDDMIELIIDF